MVVDQEARDLANRAISLIEAHERVCVANAKSSQDWRASTNNTLRRIEGVLWTSAVGIIGSLFGVVILLLFKHP